MEYDRARRSAHKMNTLFQRSQLRAGFAGPIGKGLSYIVSSEDDLREENRCRAGSLVGCGNAGYSERTYLAAKRKEQEEKPQPGKRDDQKHPNWKVDPSGYVYEVIDSNRVEGITASVLLKMN